MRPLPLKGCHWEAVAERDVTEPHDPRAVMVPGWQARMLFIGVRGHGGEEVYSNLVRTNAPSWIDCRAISGFHTSCDWGKCRVLAEILLNRTIQRFAAFNMGFRVVDVSPDVDLVHVHTHPTILAGIGRRPVIFSAGSSHYHYVRFYENWSDREVDVAYGRARKLYKRFGVLDAMLHHEPITLAYTFSRWAREEYVARGVPDWKIRVVYPGFDIGEPPPRPPSSVTTFLFLGRQPRRKGGSDALAAFRRLYAERRDVRLVYVSDEFPQEPIDGVEFHPLVPADQVGRYYQSADVFVNPTRAEGFGFTNVEAQGFGLPVISTRVGAIPEVVEDGRTGLLVPPNDPEAIFAAMLRLTQDPQMRASMGHMARQNFAARFSIGVFRSALADVYTEAIERSHA